MGNDTSCCKYPLDPKRIQETKVAEQADAEDALLIDNRMDDPAVIVKEFREEDERQQEAVGRSISSEVLDVERQKWADQQEAQARVAKLETLEFDLEETRNLMTKDTAREVGTHGVANRYGHHMELPPYQAGEHVPVLGLINPMSGAMAGHDILTVARQNPYYKTRMFNIIDVVRGKRPGGLMDVFRIELKKAREEAAKMNTRTRLISGGGDGTGSFALFIVFLALKADDERADEGLRDSGNGFIWTDEEMELHLPAIAQLPLGTANDFGNILGWGAKYPGDGALTVNGAAGKLRHWFEAVLDPSSRVVSFDLWGIMPHKGTEVDFKLAELCGKRGTCPNMVREGQRMVHLRQASKPVPFFVCLYFSAGFGAYMTARFQLNRHRTPTRNRAEYVRQALGIVNESTPPQMPCRLTGVEVDCEGEAYFPPRRDKGTKGAGYREVGFYNINWQAHSLHGADRASASARVCCGSGPRMPVIFNDGRIDMFRWKFASLLKNPGLKVQTDKKKDMLLRYAGGKGKGIFFQWDGEARFAFSPAGEDIHIYIRKVMNIPVVLGPFHNQKITGNVGSAEEPVSFAWCGETDEERQAVRQRTLRYINGDLDDELNATADEIKKADFPILSVPEPPEFTTDASQPSPTAAE